MSSSNQLSARLGSAKAAEVSARLVPNISSRQEPKVELAQIRYFVALCRERNFTRAARRCGISQPSLSNAIKALESELGGRLFERLGMSLTPLGKSVRPQFENALGSVQQITKRAAAFHRRQKSQHRLVTTRPQRTDARVLLTEALSREEMPQPGPAHMSSPPPLSYDREDVEHLQAAWSRKSASSPRRL